MIHSEDGIIHC